ncbi:MAG: serine hydrolase [Pyrinomonadaceae bacterium]|nr:serine hydrolase [Pyrinomonadaceae bacterium]
MKRTVSHLLVFLFAACGLAIGQTNTPRIDKQFTTDLDEYVRTTLENLPEIPGAAIVVVAGDRIVYERGFGLANREAGTKANEDTLFYIASSTKSFTALAAALLDREGKIKLNDPILNYASGLTLKNEILEKVTIRDLLIHTSGLRNSALGFRMAFSGESEPKEMANVFAAATTFDESAYGKYAYTNLGYNIYAVLLQNHLKMRWQDLLQREVFDPLRLRNTTAYISRAKAKKWTVASPYIIDLETGKSTPSRLPKTDATMQSAGGMFASVSDLGRWLLVNINDGRLNGKQVFPEEVLKAVHTGYTANEREMPPFSGAGEYGLGWQIGKYKGRKVIYHHGGFPGYRSHVSYLPESKIGVAVMVNDDAAGGQAADLLATFAYDRLLEGPKAVEAYSKQLQELVVAYENRKKQMMAGFAERAKRASQLTKPVSEYTGRFENKLFGTVVVESNGTGFTVKLGTMRSVATNFTRPDTIRVELIPGRGEVIQFTKGKDGTITALTYAGNDFERVTK